MDSNAAGQFLGYMIQIPRALIHLLKGGPGDVICVEVLGDVSTTRNDGQQLFEEDKSSTRRNPLSNKSTNLWKTFYNWIKAIHNGEIDINNSYFIIFSNKSPKKSLVNLYNDISSLDQAKEVINHTRELLKKIPYTDRTWNYYSYVVIENKELFAHLLTRFELQIGKFNAYTEIYEELRRQHIPNGQIKDLTNILIGWLHNELSDRIARCISPRITWEEFDKAIKVSYERARCNELIDFTSAKPINQGDIRNQVNLRPFYIKQIEAIDCNSDDIIEAVTEYLKAKVNRDKWIEDGIIDETIAVDFQERLLKFWNNSKRRIEITNRELGEKDKGMLLLLECKDRQETIREMTPPNSVIAGTYHALADTPLLGWHPNWEKLFKNNQKES